MDTIVCLATPPDIGSNTSIILKDRTGYNGTSSIEALEMYKRGHTFFNAEEWEFARRMGKKAVKRDKTFVEAYDMLGIANRKLGRLDAALAAFQRSHELSPDGKVALVNMGLIQLQQREWSAAEHAYLELMKRHPNYAEGPYELIQCIPKQWPT